ncbi:MAG TPA: GNAT family N-acetyltransferase [Casimicrobiaceae bacterium]|nr:GNAT family N-acetyltransferase [Casimicrobiaceae bacterium]
MTAALHIRPAQLADIPALIALANVVWRTHYPGIITEAQIDYMLARGYAPDALAGFIGSGDSGIDLAYVGEALAGFAAWMLVAGARELKLDKLYVDPARQRAGIGGALIERVVGHARERSRDVVILNVNKGNTGAIAAYRRHGFAVREAVVIDIGGGFVMDDYVMQRTV